MLCKIARFFPFWRPHPRQFSGHITKIATDSALISWIFLNFDKFRLKNSIIILVPPIGTKIPILGVLAHGLSRKTVSLEEQIMSKDKYPSVFSPQMETIVFIILQIVYATRAVFKIGGYQEP